MTPPNGEGYQHSKALRNTDVKANFSLEQTTRTALVVTKLKRQKNTQETTQKVQKW